MYDDPIVAEMRRLRDEYARRFDYDLDAICNDLHEQQSRGGRLVVHRTPRRPVQPMIPTVVGVVQENQEER
jgi:hypothetical protein